MPTLTAADGGVAGGVPPYPNFQPQAITFALLDGSGTSFRLPRNPTDFDSDQQTIATDRPTLDGILTYVWGPDVEAITLQGFTREEGPAPWYQFRQQFQGKLAKYTNTHTGQRLTVYISRVRVFTSQKPATYRWLIECKAAA
jgi:hypothetical protein